MRFFRGLSVCLFLACVLPPALLANDAPKKLELSAEEQQLLELTNKEREKAKLPALKPQLLLFQAARAHSQNMARQEKMTHELDGKGPGERAEEAGYRYRSLGENVAAGERWKLDAVVEAWMNSEGHRKNLLSDKFTEAGFGIAKDDKGVVYYTHVFGRPRSQQD